MYVDKIKWNGVGAAHWIHPSKGGWACLRNETSQYVMTQPRKERVKALLRYRRHPISISKR